MRARCDSAETRQTEGARELARVNAELQSTTTRAADLDNQLSALRSQTDARMAQMRRTHAEAIMTMETRDSRRTMQQRSADAAQRRAEEGLSAASAREML